tara:strand:- start:148 stop:786 length:639 start_codon:yes stop_codon:yes gene_type:complete
MPAPTYGHWDVSLVGRFDPDKHLGFVYQITHVESGKSYIGCKHLWRFKKRKRVKASEWRYYCSSSNYLKPDIKKYGKRAFKFEILMLCPNKRDLYYNEAKIQMELGVLESEDYYNANVGGKRFFRPVSSYISQQLRNKISGIKNSAYRGPFHVHFKNGSVEKVEDRTIRDYCKDNGLDYRRLYELRKDGKLRNSQKKCYKGITKLEYEHEQS